MHLTVDIKKKLGDFRLDISFEAEDGVFALLGASGCGKSMTLKCIAGIEKPDEGRIVLGDRVLFDSKEKIDLPPQRRRVGYMFQDYALFPNMTVRQNVEVGRRGRQAGLSTARRSERPAEDSGSASPSDSIESILRRFHVEELAEHYPGQLSGGQKQRVAMARLVAQEPDVILLDEPFSALDSHLKWQLEQEMKETLAAIDCPVLFVSHDRDEVYHLAEKVCCMEQGKTGSVQPMREFFEDPQTREAAILSGCKNVEEIEILGAGRIRVPVWDLELEVGREIPAETKYVGIRAHALKPIYDTNPEAEEVTPAARIDAQDGAEPAPRAAEHIALCDVTLQEDPFEWTVFFRATPKAKEKLQWKVPKKAGEAFALPIGFVIDAEGIMLLK